MKITCKNCSHIYTKECPIRVWGRSEGNEMRLDAQVNPNTDFCSRMRLIVEMQIGVTDALESKGST